MNIKKLEEKYLRNRKERIAYEKLPSKFKERLLFWGIIILIVLMNMRDCILISECLIGAIGGIIGFLIVWYVFKFIKKRIRRGKNE